jgi:hypothetical protein
MNLESLLTATPVEQWRTKQAIVLDWYDGPRQALGSLAVLGGEFFFELLAERASLDNLDDRLFRLWELPSGSIAGALALLRDLGIPTQPVWVPVWRFPDVTTQTKVEQQLDALQRRRQMTSLVVASRDLQSFQGCWQITNPSNGHGDWFSLLGISQQQAN